jgi:oligopeptidase B
MSAGQTGTAGAVAPVAKRIETARRYHDDEFVDHYEWLRDKSDPEVLAHLEAENAHVEDVTAYQEPLRQKIFDEIKARTKETDLSVPLRRGDWWYYGRSFEGKQYGVHCRCPIAERRGRRPRLLRPGRQYRQPGRQPAGVFGRRQG